MRKEEGDTLISLAKKHFGKTYPIKMYNNQTGRYETVQSIFSNIGPTALFGEKNDKTIVLTYGSLYAVLQIPDETSVLHPLKDVVTHFESIKE